MPNSSIFEFGVFFDERRYADQAVVIAERRWVRALERSATDPEEVALRKAELVAAREFSTLLFKRTMAMAIPGDHLRLASFSSGEQATRPPRANSDVDNFLSAHATSNASPDHRDDRYC